MTVRAGTVTIDFGNGVFRTIKADSANVAKALKAFPGSRVVRPNQQATNTMMGGVPRPPDFRGMGQKVLDALPTAGGIAGQVTGGALGTPALALGPWGAVVPPTMSVAGAGMGGAIGQTAREAGYRAMGLGDAPGTVGGASEEQAKGSAMGEMIGPAFKLLATNDLGEPSSSSAAASDNRLYLKGEKHLFCVAE